MVLGREVRSEQPHGREIDATGLQQREDDREATYGPRDLDAVVGLVLGESEDLPALGEEGGVALAQVDVTSVQLGQVRHQQGRGLSFSGSQSLQLRDEITVAEATERREQPPWRVVVCFRHPILLPPDEGDRS